ncbi:Pentapeptide repeats (8 copies) [compost metagenome]
MRDCDLTRVTLSKAMLKGADLRGAKLDGMNLKALDVTGVRMDMEQAVLFLRSYGAKID